ncbi:MAG TPA: AraC family transcriptional regulator [Reyranella sp.]|nr:AraC family transcriptional regulator [Reyranella sp.]
MPDRGAVLRTSLAVDRGIETIEGRRAAWHFRPHYHAGDEIVRLTAGRARLRLRDTSRIVEAGETVIVPAGAVHRFEPVDREGWAFVSDFVIRRDVPANKPEERLVARAIELLSRRHGLRSDPEALARACGVSAGHLSRTFRRVTETNLHNFHVVQALQQSKGLLKAGAAIAEAAIDAGFYDQAHLNREFVRTYGFTPRAYQAAWKTGKTETDQVSSIQDR